MRLLPINEDFTEYNTVFKCLVMHVYKDSLDQMKQHIPKLLEVVAAQLGPQSKVPGQESKLTDETRAMLTQWVVDINAKFPADLKKVASKLKPAQAQALANC